LENFQILTLNVLPYANVTPLLGAVVSNESSRQVFIDNIQHQAARRVEPNGTLPVLGIKVVELLARSGPTPCVKLDCEGMEATILREMLPVARPRHIVGEWHKNRDEVMGLLAGYNAVEHANSSETGIFAAVPRL
jgi:hypothetical protein